MIGGEREPRMAAEGVAYVLDVELSRPWVKREIVQERGVEGSSDEVHDAELNFVMKRLSLTNSDATQFGVRVCS